MSCQSCGNASVTYSSGSTPTGCSNGCQPMPRRVASPPVTPFLIRNVNMARSTWSGKMLVGGCNTDEVMVLDGTVDGTVFFNAATGKVEARTLR